MWQGQVTTANTNTDGSTGTYVSVATGGTNGSRIDWIRIQAIATSTVGSVRLFITDTSGSVTRLFRDVEVTAVTVAEGTAPWGTDLDYTATPIILESGDILKATTYDGEDFNIVCFGGDF